MRALVPRGQPDRETDRQTDRQTDREIRETGRQTDRAIHLATTWAEQFYVLVSDGLADRKGHRLLGGAAPRGDPAHVKTMTTLADVVRS